MQVSDGFNLVFDLALKYQQESILAVFKDNSAELIYMDLFKDNEILGQWTTVDNVDNIEAWTKINNEFKIAA